MLLTCWGSNTVGNAYHYALQAATQVEEQVRHVALAVKAGTSVSDLRHHTFGGPLARARMLYFRAATPGACTYFDDRRDGLLPHGACWADICPDLQVPIGCCAGPT